MRDRVLEAPPAIVEPRRDLAPEVWDHQAGAKVLATKLRPSPAPRLKLGRRVGLLVRLRGLLKRNST